MFVVRFSGYRLTDVWLASQHVVSIVCKDTSVYIYLVTGKSVQIVYPRALDAYAAMVSFQKQISGDSDAKEVDMLAASYSMA